MGPSWLLQRRAVPVQSVSGRGVVTAGSPGADVGDPGGDSGSRYMLVRAELPVVKVSVHQLLRAASRQLIAAVYGTRMAPRLAVFKLTRTAFPAGCGRATDAKAYSSSRIAHSRTKTAVRVCSISRASAADVEDAMHYPCDNTSHGR